MFVCLSVCRLRSIFLSLCLSVGYFLSFFLSIFLSVCRILFFFLFLVSNFSYNKKFLLFSSSRNSRRERELYLVPENRWREGFGNCFYENFGNCREMTGKLWCLLRTSYESRKLFHDMILKLGSINYAKSDEITCVISLCHR